jgi:hypothetical protein
MTFPRPGQENSETAPADQFCNSSVVHFYCYRSESGLLRPLKLPRKQFDWPYMVEENRAHLRTLIGYFVRYVAVADLC